MKESVSTLKLILLFLTSTPVFDVAADMYFGTLRGENIIELKSPISGVIEQNVKIDGLVNENVSPFKIKSIEVESKKEILNIKIKTLSSKLSRLIDEYKNAKISYSNGFISNSELDEKKDVIDEAKISLQELKIELAALSEMLEMGNPVIKKKFLVRQFHTVNNQVVNAGDRIVSIETVDNYYIDIKFDPVSMNGRIQDKKIIVKSLVTGQKGDAIVHKISNPVDNNNTQGAKIASLLIHADKIDLPQLLDTVFEVEIHDRHQD